MDQLSACVFTRFPIELSTVLTQIGQVGGGNGTNQKAPPEASGVFREEKLKCDCKEMELTDTLLTRAIKAFLSCCGNAKNR